jgi:hypothetical protein
VTGNVSSPTVGAGDAPGAWAQRRPAAPCATDMMM